MSSFTDKATWTENPFVFQTSEPMPLGPIIDIESIPLHKALYEKLVKLVFPSPKSKTDPWSDKGRREWTPYDPVTTLDPTTVAPGLIEGMPLQSRRRKEPQGVGGKATFLNLIVDVSISMRNPMNGSGTHYGYYDGLPLGGEDLARVVTPLMIKVAKQNGDKFNVVTFGSRAEVDWPGPATDYDDAIDYYTNSSTAKDSTRPLAGAQDSTMTEKGLKLVRREMERYLVEENVNVKSAVTIVISDGDFNYKSCMPPDNWLRQFGPVFYVFIAPKVGAMDGNVKRLQAFLKQYNPTLDCKGCVVSFAPSVGHGGTVAGFAGSLVEMCQANAGEQVDCDSYNR